MLGNSKVSWNPYHICLTSNLASNSKRRDYPCFKNWHLMRKTNMITGVPGNLGKDTLLIAMELCRLLSKTTTMVNERERSLRGHFHVE